ncbi:type II 3-dehydroquinate dehydratase [Leucothrix sargassi]|nr:type II 3-dehydroquinate dehydratase [Leucothrix sargassi]
MKKIIVLNGPNLNLLGVREPEQYGSQTLEDVEQLCIDAGKRLGIEVVCQQTNHEGVMLDTIHAAREGVLDGSVLGIVLNAGAYTHTSVALHDAIKGSEVPVMEVHISNVHARESFRHHSYISPAAAGILVGLGVDGYVLGIEALARKAGIATH